MALQALSHRRANDLEIGRIPGEKNVDLRAFITSLEWDIRAKPIAGECLKQVASREVRAWLIYRGAPGRNADCGKVGEMERTGR